MAQKIKGNIITLAISGLLLGVLSWAFYRLVYQGSTDLLGMFGITNGYAQNGLVFGIVLLLLIIMSAVGAGVSGKKIYSKLFG